MTQHILLVEDEEDTANLLKSVLEREGFLVLHAHDGRQAKTLVETMRAPALVLLDLVVPYVSGSELLTAIRRQPNWQHIPIIVLSADSHEPDIQQALSNGATAYVLKQKGSKELLQEVKRIIPTSVPRRTVTKRTATAPRTRRTTVRHQPRSSRRKNQAV